VDEPSAQAGVVEVKRFDAMGLDLANCKRPIFLKVDVEGHELEVLKGFGASLAQVDDVVLEVQNEQNRAHAHDATELFAFMAAQGFNYSKALYAWFDGYHEPAYFDVLFRRTPPAGPSRP
jgi:hypothetical protein